MRRLKALFPLALGLFSLSLSSCGSDVTSTVYAFDTSCRMNLYSAEAAYLDEIETCVSAISRYSDTYTNRENGYAYAINKKSNKGVPITVNQTFFDLVTLGLEYEELTDGYFSIMTGNLSALWKEALETGTRPAQSEIDQAVADIANTELVLNEDELTITRNGDATLDFGGLAKGFALDESLRILKEHDVGKFLLNYGKSSVAFGRYKDDGSYNASLTDKNAQEILSLTSLMDTCIGVSGSTEQYAVIDGETYTHIVNPKTGEAKAQYELTLALGPSGALCDALSTAFMLMDQDEAVALAAECGYGYLFYSSDGTLKYLLPDVEVSRL